MSTDPIYYFIGGASIEGGFSLTDSLEPFVGGNRISLKSDALELESRGVIGGATWYKSTILSDSLYLRASVGQRQGTFKDLSVEAHKYQTKETTGTIGYQWKWDSGFNIKLGGGIQNTQLKDNIRSDDGRISKISEINGTTPTFEFKTGFYI